MAREEGKVNDQLDPVVRLAPADGTIVECVVDTGFNPTLMLPAELIRERRSPILGTEEFRVVGERETHRAQITVISVKWLDDEIEVPAVISEAGFALIGAELMIDCVLTVDYSAAVVQINRQA